MQYCLGLLCLMALFGPVIFMIGSVVDEVSK
jgi:hypothetical protein